MKLCSRTKCWQVTLIFHCHNNFHLFQERVSYFQIWYTEWPCHFYFIVPRLCLFLYLICFNLLLYFFFYFGYQVMIFLASNYLTSLQTFFLTLSRLQTIYFFFSDPANNFFQYFSTPSPLPPPPPSQKKNGLSLNKPSNQLCFIYKLIL